MKKLIVALLVFFSCGSIDYCRENDNSIIILHGDKLVKKLTLAQFYYLVRKAQLFEEMELAEQGEGKVVLEFNRNNVNKFKIIWFNKKGEVIKELVFEMSGNSV